MFILALVLLLNVCGLECETPPTADVVGDMRITLDIGDSVDLVCNVTGDPVPTVTWLHNYQNLRANHVPEGNTLHVNDVTGEDLGTYRCKADNGVGDAAFAFYFVNIRTPPTITMLQAKTRNGITYPGSATCSIKGYPSPTGEWSRYDDGVWLPVENDDKYDLFTVKRRTIWFSDLRIRDMEAEDIGVYRCRGQNKLGTDERNLTISADEGPPYVYATGYNKTFNVAAFGSKTLKCRVYSYPGPSLVYWEFNGYFLADGEELVLTEVTRRDDGVYRCFAENEYGESAGDFTKVNVKC